MGEVLAPAVEAAAVAPHLLDDGADAAVIVTEWDAFRALELERARGLLNEPLLVDLRNLYDRTEVERYGFRYVAVGR